MSDYNKLSEKDELIKALRESQDKVKSSKIENAIGKRIKEINGDKTITK